MVAERAQQTATSENTNRQNNQIHKRAANRPYWCFQGTLKVLNTAWTRPVVEVRSIYHPFVFMLWFSDFYYSSTLHVCLHTGHCRVKHSISHFKDV